jgi:beta-mannosidase
MTTEVSTGETSMVVEVEVADVDVWWPHGYGDQPLYQVAVTLADEGDVLDVWRGRVGFRNVTLDTSPDDQGTPFTLLVNEIPVFARGVNWIPDDSFPSRVDRARYLERLTQAKDANVNLIRVWGGGIYESDDFYDVCDELGLLVWQDFLFACAAYSEEEPLRSEVIAEARGAVTRLSPHPSLAIWNGCNENIWGYWDWGWQDDLGDRSWGWGYYSEILPAIVEELDPTRPYSPGSPYSFSPDRPPNEQAHGTLHIWDVWNQVDYTVYRDYSPRFVAEFGFQGPPTWATLTQSIHDDPRRSDSPAMLLHQKAEDGNGKLARGLEGHLPQPQTFEDWHWSTSLNQARAVAFGIEHFRSLSPGCMGSIVWQLNDCWPVTSWAAVDGYGRRKPLWYALRHAFVDRLLTFQPRDGDVALVLVNDSSEPWTGDLEVTRRAFDGTVLATVTVQADLASRSTATIALPPELTRAADPKAELLCASSSFGQASWQFVEDVDAAFPVAAYDSEIQRIDGGYRVSVTALTFIKDLALLADRVAPDAAVDEMLVSLLPGETATFDVLTAASLTAEDLTSPSVLRCANQLVAQP